jgi:NADPH-dependent curcumin reductase CurA
VGGPILDAVLGRLATNGRVALCGVISSYLTGEHPGPSNYTNLLARTGLMQGFNTLANWGRFDEAFGHLRTWAADGRLVYRSQVFDGLEQAVDALNGLFTGANIGKSMVRVAAPTSSP